jgi:hypothetical protein
MDNTQNMMLSSAIRNAKIRIDISNEDENYSGLIASFRLYNNALKQDEIIELLNATIPGQGEI